MAKIGNLNRGKQKPVTNDHSEFLSRFSGRITTGATKDGMQPIDHSWKKGKSKKGGKC